MLSVQFLPIPPAHAPAPTPTNETNSLLWLLLFSLVVLCIFSQISEHLFLRVCKVLMPRCIYLISSNISIRRVIAVPLTKSLTSLLCPPVFRIVNWLPGIFMGDDTGLVGLCILASLQTQRVANLCSALQFIILINLLMLI